MSSLMPIPREQFAPSCRVESWTGRRGFWLAALPHDPGYVIKATIWLIAVFMLANPNRSQAEEPAVVIPDKFVVAFGTTDKNKDQRISIEEFLENRNPAEVAKRDFKLFDLDENGFLDLVEFAAIPNVIEGNERGPIPDPMNQVLDQLVDSLDKALGDWNEQPNLEIQTARFFQILNNRFASSNIRFNPGQSDKDRNGSISRNEARRFLEMQLGIRRGDGQPLRRPDGRIFNYMLFLHLDLNKDHRIERGEFLQRAFFSLNPEQDFKAGNPDGDDNITFDEWWNVPNFGTNDPINEFREMDTNLDGFVSPEELKAGTAEWKKNVAAYTFPGFDLDHDGRFSLFEYRLTPQANMVLPWDWKLTDNDGDFSLSFAEFQFDPTVFHAIDRQQFPLLRFMMFHRFDQNANGKLEQNEYFFKIKTVDEFFVMNEDGSGWKSLFLFPGHCACGSVAVSPDGESIAFDSWPDGQQAGSAIFVMRLGTGKPRQLCSGMMPSWSKDGQLLVCSRNEPKYGIWMVEVDGEGRDFLGVGWGAQWSPDGQQIALTQGQELKILNIATDEYQTILTPQTNPYQQILWNMAWSPDGSQLCFKGLKQDGTQDVATVNVVDAKHVVKVHHSGHVAVNADFAWHPTQNRIVYAMICNERSVMQLYEFDPTKNDPPQLVKGQDETRNNTDICWTPDGKQLIVVSGDF